jgi:[glutamine synthetase] adenylyltransferase / [glutamine synthetase]-adenylyl-L-tyrosine phosphorylase
MESDMTRSLKDLPQQLLDELEKSRRDLLAVAIQAGSRLPQDTTFTESLNRVLVFSPFAAQAFIQDPVLLVELWASGDLTRSYQNDFFRQNLSERLTGVSDEDQLMHRMRVFRRREILRIIWRDLSDASDLPESMDDLSNLADACIGAALEILEAWAVKQYGEPVNSDERPQRLVVIGMGKLGARELNLSSDIDLIFGYPSVGSWKISGRTETAEAFFTRLCRRLIKVIGTNTADGFVFRVDTNLRPFGGNGPLVMSFDGMESYYQSQGREWERYAWIKARVVAGDQTAGEQLLKCLKPFIYRRYLDYGVYEAIREMKASISAEVVRKGKRHNVKLGEGGIREVEFFGQVFQLLRGGVLPTLQIRPILKVLAELGRLRLVPDEECQTLSTAYRFLRRVEHRLQAVADRQTHDLPDSDIEKKRLAAAMGFSDWEEFGRTLGDHCASVHRYFKGLLELGSVSGEKDGQDADEKAFGLLSAAWETGQSGDPIKSVLNNWGYDDPDRALQLLTYLKEDPATQALSATGHRRLARLIPLLIKAVAKTDHPTEALSRILDLIRIIERRTAYLSLLLENPSAIEHLARFADASPMVISYLAQHPVLLDELLDPRTLYAPPGKTEMAADIQDRIAAVDRDDVEGQIEALCVSRQVNTLRVAAADVTGVLPLMKTSDHLTWLAEGILACVTDLAWEHLTAKHGTPLARLDEVELTKGFIVAAYGKLGGIELGYGSDLDLVFIHAGASEQTSGGPRPMDTRQFYSRVGQRIVHFLTSPTRAGVLYETDMRLRPSGSSGPLVCHVDAFESYQLNEAWIWEHQALVRARAICGDRLLMERFEGIRRRVIGLSRDRTTLAKAVLEMRERMRRERLKTSPDLFDLKEGNGGIVDIEFLVQFLVLLESHRNPDLSYWSDNVRQLEALSDAKILSDTDAHLLREAYLTYRSAAHRRSLLDRPPVVPDDRFSDLRDAVIDVWNRILVE